MKVTRRLLTVTVPHAFARTARRAIPPISMSAVLLIAALIAAGCVVWWWGRPTGSVLGSPARRHVLALLEAVHTVPRREKAPGYQRDCTGASACVFGPAWSDQTTAPDSRNGCSTRDDVLRRDLRSVRVDPRNPCRPIGGILVDPYTGESADVAAIGLRRIHIDHVFPLSAAWDLGASAWPADRRAAFANDTAVNLLAAGERANEDKGDKTPGDWMPPAVRWRCFYAGRYLSSAITYALPVTDADRRALATAADLCPS